VRGREGSEREKYSNAISEKKRATWADIVFYEGGLGRVKAKRWEAVRIIVVVRDQHTKSGGQKKDRGNQGDLHQGKGVRRCRRTATGGKAQKKKKKKPPI